MIKLRELTVRRWPSYFCLSLILAAALSYGTSFWTDAFIKAIAMGFSYKTSFFVLMFLACLLCRRYESKRWWHFGMIGIAAGSLSGYLAVVLSNFFVKDGLAGTLKSIEMFGLLGVLTIDLFATLILGGWVIGAILFLLIWAFYHFFASTNQQKTQ